MPRSNLARVMAPTLVAAVPMIDMDSAVKDSKRSTKVMEIILSLPPSYWSNIMSPNDECSSPTGVGYPGEDPATPGTPEMLRGTISFTTVLCIRIVICDHLFLSNCYLPFLSTTGYLPATNPN